MSFLTPMSAHKTLLERQINKNSVNLGMEFTYFKQKKRVEVGFAQDEAQRPL